MKTSTNVMSKRIVADGINLICYFKTEHGFKQRYEYYLIQLLAFIHSFIHSFARLFNHSSFLLLSFFRYSVSYIVSFTCRQSV